MHPSIKVAFPPSPYFFSSSSSNDTHSAAIIVRSTFGATVTKYYTPYQNCSLYLFFFKTIKFQDGGAGLTVSLSANISRILKMLREMCATGSTQDFGVSIACSRRRMELQDRASGGEEVLLFASRKNVCNSLSIGQAPKYTYRRRR